MAKSLSCNVNRAIKRAAHKIRAIISCCIPSQDPFEVPIKAPFVPRANVHADRRWTLGAACIFLVPFIQIGLWLLHPSLEPVGWVATIIVAPLLEEFFREVSTAFSWMLFVLEGSKSPLHLCISTQTNYFVRVGIHMAWNYMSFYYQFSMISRIMVVTSNLWFAKNHYQPDPILASVFGVKALAAIMEVVLGV